LISSFQACVAIVEIFVQRQILLLVRAFAALGVSIPFIEAVVVQAVPSLIFWELRRKDFWEQIAHHLVTLFLIVYSSRHASNLCASYGVHRPFVSVWLAVPFVKTPA